MNFWKANIHLKVTRENPKSEEWPYMYYCYRAATIDCLRNLFENFCSKILQLWTQFLEEMFRDHNIGRKIYVTRVAAGCMVSLKCRVATAHALFKSSDSTWISQGSADCTTAWLHDNSDTYVSDVFNGLYYVVIWQWKSHNGFNSLERVHVHLVGNFNTVPSAYSLSNLSIIILRIQHFLRN